MLRRVSAFLEISLLFLWLFTPISTYAQSDPAPQIVSFSPARFSFQDPAVTSVSLEFDQAIDPASIHAGSFRVQGSQSGYHAGTFTFGSQNRNITYESNRAFHAGELVTVMLTQAITNNNGTPLSASFQWSFYIRSVPGSGKFGLDTTFSSGDGPHFIGVGDWNGDANLDLVVPNSKSDNTYIWMNSGTTLFEQTDSIGVGGLPRATAIGDWDEDSHLDLAVSNESSGTVSILQNNGSGHFLAPSSTLNVDVEPTFVASGDLNGDGLDDLVTTNVASNTVSVLMNAGSGAFQPQTTYPVAQKPQTPFLSDLNNDGHLDIVATSLVDNVITCLINDGSGIFNESRVFSVGVEPHFVTGQDFNGDGAVDLVVANRGSNAVAIMINQNGQFSVDSELNVGTDPLAVSVGDWDGDDDADLAIVNRLSNDLYLALNDGTGHFAVDSVYTTDAQPRYVSHGDLDGDGDLDLMVANWESNTINVFLNQNGPGQNQAPGRPTVISRNRQMLNTRNEDVHLSWYPPFDPDGDQLHFRVEIASDASFSNIILSFDSRTDTTGFQPAPPISGNADSVVFNVTAELDDGTYWWRLKAWDGQTYGPPSEARTFISDSSAPHIGGLVLLNPALQPNWYNPNLSSVMNFRMTYDEPYANKLTFKFGQSGIVQEMENLAGGTNQVVEVPADLSALDDGPSYLFVSVFDSVGNFSKDSTAIAIDATPPFGAQAQSPDTSRSETFMVTWGGTASDGSGSGISGRFDVRMNVDGGTWQDWLDDFAGESAEFQGEHGHAYGFEVVAYDGVGNLEPFQQSPETVTLVDTSSPTNEVPTIQDLSSSTVVTEGDSLTIFALVQDDQQNVDARLYFKLAGELTYESQIMTNAGGGLYQTTLSADRIERRGISYYLEVWDGANLVHDPSSNWDSEPHHVSIRVTGQDNQGLVKATPQPFGDQQNAFRMISVPLLLQDGDAGAVLADDLGPYDSDHWQLLQFDREAQTYLEFPNVESFSPGKAFWLLVRDSLTFIDSGIGETVAANRPFEIELKKGWNLIGNPFDFPVSWNDVIVPAQSQDVIMGPYTYFGQWLLPDKLHILEPWEGYAVYSAVAGVVIALQPVEVDSLQSGMSPDLTENTDWYFGIEAVCDRASDGQNFIGVASDALDEWDRFDYLEPPAVGDFVSLRLPHPDWQGFPGAFSSDVRAPFSEGQVWEIELETNISGHPISLFFNNVESLPANFEAVLVNAATEERFQVEKSSRYFFPVDSTQSKYEFELIVGTSAFLDAYFTPEQEDDNDIPQTFQLQQNFPNPFNPTTTIVYSVPERAQISIKVYDLLGQEVATLVDETKEAGEYEFLFDASALATGVYFYQMRALTGAGSSLKQFKETRRLLYLK